jgi:hypothetical protein
MDYDQLEHLKQLIQAKGKRLRVLELREAQLGVNLPAEIVVEIATLRDDIADLEKQISLLQYKRDPAPVRVSFKKDNKHEKNTTTVEIVIKGDYGRWSPDIEKATIRALAAIMELSVQEVTILKVSGGSIVLLLEVPDVAAKRLYALYQEKNPAIAGLDIDKVTIHPLKPMQQGSDKVGANYFTFAPEYLPNWTAAREISLNVVRAFRPKESRDSEAAVEMLIDEASMGRVVPRGTDTAFGHGTLDLIIQLVVPVVVTVLTNLLLESGRENLGGLKDLPDGINRQIDQIIGQLAPQAKFILSGRQRAELARLVRETIVAYLQAQSASGGQRGSTVLDLRRQRLEQELDALKEEYQAVANQQNITLNAADRIRLARQLASLEQQIDEIETQLSQHGG